MFKIGDFSRLARVTIRALHHYDESGLLQPAHVDMHTGYRYYGAAQLLTLQRILLLKDLGFSLDEIRHLTSASLAADEFDRRLQARRAQLAASIAQDESRLRRLDALRDSVLSAASNEIAAVALRETPAVEVYAVRERVTELGTPVQGLFETAELAVARARLRADTSPFLIFHDADYREQDADIEVCIPVSRAAAELGTKQVAATAMACVTYEGPYEKTAMLYEAMLRWLERSKLAIDGPLREVYHRFGADQSGYRLPPRFLAASSADYITELQVPVATRVMGDG